MIFSSLLLLSASTIIYLSNGDSVDIPISCNTLSDGLHYIKPTEDGSIIPVYCDSGYTVINVLLNQDAVSSYFTSFYQYYPSMGGIFSSDCEVKSCSSSWREWWIPATDDTNFRVSKDCQTCDASLSYGDNTAYYVTNYYFCWNKHHFYECEYDRDELALRSDLTYQADDDTVAMCNVCDDSLRTSSNTLGRDGTSSDWLDCASLQLDADTVTSSNHDDCVEGSSVVVKPTVNLGGNFCTCYSDKNSAINDEISSVGTHFTVEYTDESELNTLLPSISSSVFAKYDSDENENDPLLRIVRDEKIPKKTSDECSENEVYLSNKDFEKGTYRITECGEYILTEDILIHFSKPDNDKLNDIDWSPNSYDYNDNDGDLPWFPLLSQQTEDQYEGVQQMRGKYQLGFYAAITIESDDVTINLNNHRIDMDYTYYFQQRFFILISLGNRMFVNDQGPGNFGRQTFFLPDNIVIKDGTLGLTSHHGIHGNEMSNFEISNVKIENFDVAGLACNGCKNGIIKNVVVGPQNDNIPTLGKYTHARAMVPRLSYIVENYGDETVTFGGPYGGTEVSMTELVDELVEEMDLIYNHFIHGIDYENDEKYSSVYSEQWSKAKELFLNPNGYLDGGSAYGILLNGVGTGVTSFGRRKGDKGENIELNNVEIFGIQNQAWERMWGKISERQMQGFMFDTLDWLSIIDEENGNSYKGNAYFDLVFATSRVANSDEYCLFNTLYVTQLEGWAFEDETDLLDDLDLKCGSDVQSHDAKGTVALRVDAVEDVTLENIYIHDINNHGVLGTTQYCGEYDVIGFLSQTYPLIEPGYTGTRSIGLITTFASINRMSNIIIENLGSKYGTAIGAAIYEGTTLEHMSNFDIYNIKAGWGFRDDTDETGMTEDDVLALGAPNYVPMACTVHLGEGEDDYPIILKTDSIDESSVVGSKINGYSTCSDTRMGVLSKESKNGENSRSEHLQGLLNMFEKQKIPMKALNNKLENSYNTPYNYVLLVSGIVAIAMMVALITVWKCLSTSMCHKILNYAGIDEYSPLLDINERRGVNNKHSNENSSINDSARSTYM